MFHSFIEVSLNTGTDARGTVTTWSQSVDRLDFVFLAGYENRNMDQDPGWSGDQRHATRLRQQQERRLRPAAAVSRACDLHGRIDCLRQCGPVSLLHWQRRVSIVMPAAVITTQRGPLDSTEINARPTLEVEAMMYELLLAVQSSGAGCSKSSCVSTLCSRWAIGSCSRPRGCLTQPAPASHSHRSAGGLS